MRSRSRLGKSLQLKAFDAQLSFRSQTIAENKRGGNECRPVVVMTGYCEILTAIRAVTSR
jgi:ActR/RegA family two-component response regulator